MFFNHFPLKPRLGLSPVKYVVLLATKLVMHTCLIFDCFLPLKPKLRLSLVKCVLVPATKLIMRFHFDCRKLGEIMAGAYVNLASGHLVRFLVLLVKSIMCFPFVYLNNLYLILVNQIVLGRVACVSQLASCLLVLDY